MNIDAKKIPELLQLIRRQPAASREQLARELSVSYATVNRRENHPNTPLQRARARLAEFFQLMIGSGKSVLPEKVYAGEVERSVVNCSH